MSEKISPQEEEIQEFINPETLNNKELEKILERAPVEHLRLIEEFDPTVAPHRDQVLVGSIGHKDQVFEGEISLAPGKKMLVVYKPDSGMNQGSLTEKNDITVPENSSLSSHKEQASWIIAQKLGLDHVSVPTVIRELDQGKGSIRPYIKGQTIASLAEDEIDKVYMQKEDMEDFALYDFVLGYPNRLKQQNMICRKNGEVYDIKSIDHSLTMFSDDFIAQFAINGPRLLIAYNQTSDPPRLKNAPLPERLLEQLETFISGEEETRKSLKDILNSDEITSVLQRAHRALEQKIFL